MTQYSIRPARYSKGNMIVSCPSPDGMKTKAARLVGDGLKGRYTNREKGYVVSPTKAARFERLYAEGWDACPMTGALQPPSDSPAAASLQVEGQVSIIALNLDTCSAPDVIRAAWSQHRHRTINAIGAEMPIKRRVRATSWCRSGDFDAFRHLRDYGIQALNAACKVLGIESHHRTAIAVRTWES